MVKTSDDIQLIIDARSGCRHALNQLASEVHKKMYPVLYRLTQDPHLAHDLMQDTLLVMLQSITKLESVEGFWGWIYTITRSRVYDHIRKKHRREKAGFMDFDSLKADNDNSVLKTVIDKERNEFIAAAIGNLRRRYQDVLKFRHFENRSYSEVALMSQCTPQQARVRFFRAKQSLRNLLCESGFEFNY